jgi:hypothetical protein
MSWIENIMVVPSMNELAEAFDARMTPPFDTRDAGSEAQVSVLSNVRMAWKNQDQIPIPAGASAEAAVAHVLSHAARDCGVLGHDLAAPFVGVTDLWDESASLSHPLPSPFHLIEKENDFELRVFAYDVDEVRAAMERANPGDFNFSDEDLKEAGLGPDSIVIARRYFDEFAEFAPIY